MLWNSIPQQIAKENKKFIYGAVKTGARGCDFETTIQWLLDSSLIHKINRVTTPKSPLKFYEDFGAFKLFISDVGLLGAMSNTLPQQIVEKESIYSEFNGALSEQYVCQSLVANEISALPYKKNEKVVNLPLYNRHERMSSVLSLPLTSIFCGMGCLLCSILKSTYAMLVIGNCYFYDKI